MLACHPRAPLRLPWAMELLGFQPAAYSSLGNDADGLRLSRKRTIYMLKMAAKVINRSVGPKDANFRGFVNPLIINTLQKSRAI